MINPEFANYDSYDEVEFEWIKRTPSHWRITRFKDFAEILSGFTPEELQPDFYGSTPYYKVDDLNSLSDSGHISSNTWYTNYAKFVYRKSILLIPKRGMAILTNKVGITNKECVFDTNLMGLSLDHKTVNNKFIFYWARNVGLSRLADITTIPQLNNKHIYPLIISLPTLSEQQAIADYLDAKTAQINRKIELLEQKAEKYADLKQSLINETVTRGLDKNVSMKDSGVEWIDQIPKHWEVKRVNDIAALQKIKNSGLREKNLLSLSYGKLKRKDIETSFGLLPKSFETYQIVNKGNIILRLTDLQNDWTSLRVGLARERGIITSAYLCLRFSKIINPVFAYYVLHVYDLSKVFYWLGSGLRSVMKFEDIKILPFILPPLEEQKVIADYLESKTAQIEKIVETIHLEVEALKELRKTLINDVVTGKIRVYENGASAG